MPANDLRDGPGPSSESTPEAVSRSLSNTLEPAKLIQAFPYEDEAPNLVDLSSDNMADVDQHGMSLLKTSAAFPDPGKHVDRSEKEYSGIYIEYVKNMKQKNHEDLLKLLKSRSLATEDPTMKGFSLEANVRLKTYLHLIIPVNQVLNCIKQRSIRCSSELLSSDQRADQKNEVSGEIKTSGKARCDMAWKCSLKDEEGTDKDRGVFAIMEFKRLGMLDPDYFTEAQTKSSEAKGGVGSETARIHAKEKVKKLMKQATAYSRKHKTCHVALCDLRTLVLIRFRFGPGDKTSGAQDKSAGDSCDTTVIPWKESCKMRRALLGFLLEAHQQTVDNYDSHKKGQDTDKTPGLDPSPSTGKRENKPRVAKTEALANLKNNSKK